MNTRVNFSTAKLLKEKEFDSMTEPESYYCIKDLGEYYWQKMGGLIVEWEHLNETCCPNHEVPEQYLILAPTIAEVVMWLYEKHGVWISVQAPHKLLKSWYLEVYRINDEVTLIEESLFKSPTEAYSAAITHVLNNMI